MSTNWHMYRHFPLDADLKDVSGYLRHCGVEHIFTEEDGQQVLWVGTKNVVPALDDFFKRYEQQRISLPTPASAPSTNGFVAQLLAAPVSLVFCLLGVVGYLAYELQLKVLLDTLSVAPPDAGFTALEPWRIFTPMFLHFNLVHIGFNIAWMIYLGRIIEKNCTMAATISLVLVTAAASNIGEFLATNNPYFGGLSGVVYGFIGFIAVRFFIQKQHKYAIDKGVVVFTLIMMGLGFAGVVDWFIAGGVANWAHLGGLVAGIAAALISGWRNLLAASESSNASFANTRDDPSE